MAKPRTNSFLAGLADEVVSDEESDRNASRNTGFVERSNALSELASGAREEKILRWVSPTTCRPWERHNRRYDLLNESNCADLIEGFKAQGKQEFPAIVRPLTDDSNHEFEIICGARRHWTTSWLNENNYPSFQFLIEVRDLSDEEAFRLADIENRDRADLSDYERAKDYLAALDLYYGGRQDRMAARIEASTTWLSRYLDLARLPEEVVSAYSDITQIKERHARDLKPFFKDQKARRRVLDCAKMLADESHPDLDGQEILQRLKRAGQGHEKSRSNLTKQRIKSRSGKPLIDFSRTGSGDLSIKIFTKSGAESDEIQTVILDLLRKEMG